MIDIGQATPDKSHQWGAVRIRDDGRAENTSVAWFTSRSSAVTFAKKTMGRRYAIMRCWSENMDPNAHQG